MNSLRAARSAVWIAIGGLVAVSSFGTGLSLTACGESASCAKLRNDTYAIKQTWAACDPNDPYPCIKVLGNPRDCTGVLACDFAVNPHHRIEAEQTVLTIAEHSQGCYLCAIPGCVSGDLTWCEPVSRQCQVVTRLIGDSGAAVADQPPASSSGGPSISPSPEAATSPDM